MSDNNTERRAVPFVTTNLTRLTDLAAATYNSHAKHGEGSWEMLDLSEQQRWISIVGFVLDIALDAGESDDGNAMARIRADSIGARKISESQYEKAHGA